MWYVYACVAFSCDKKFIFPQSWEFIVESLKGIVVVLCHCLVVVCVVTFAFAESYLRLVMITPPGDSM